MTPRTGKLARTYVRIVVTYGVTMAYCGTAAYLVFAYAGSTEHRDLVLAAFAGLTGTASSVVGFWFGNRAAKTAGRGQRRSNERSRVGDALDSAATRTGNA